MRTSLNPWLALVAALSLSSPAFGADDAGFDAAAEWTRFLAEGQVDDYTAQAVANRLLVDGAVDAEACRREAGALAKGAEAMRVSMHVQRVAALCADATGDAEAADTYRARFAALATHALSQASDDWRAPPIRVTASADITALFAATGLEWRDEFRRHDNRRHLTVHVVAWDEKAGRERQFSYDFGDTMVTLHREPEQRYPVFRRQYFNGVMKSLAENGNFAARDQQAEHAAWRETEPRARIEALRDMVGDGGYRASLLWLNFCHQTPFDECGGGLVDALLDHAEGGDSMTTLVLALVYGQGVGVERDEARAAGLVDRVEKKLQGGRAAIEYARNLITLQGDADFPAWLRDRLARAAGDGSAEATLLLSLAGLQSEDAAAVAAAREPLVPVARKGHVGAASALGASYDRDSDYASALPFLRIAAEGGDPDAQERLGRMSYYGQGVTKDIEAALRWYELAAHGGDPLAGERRAYHALGVEDDRAAAMEWFRAAAYDGNDDAKMELAELMAEGVPGVEPDPVRARRVLEEIDSPEARRRLALMLVDSEREGADPAQARKLLEQDRDDAESLALLGVGLADGMFGDADPAAAERVLQPALEALEPYAAGGWATWLYYSGDENRERAIDLWRRAAAAMPDDDEDPSGLRNNYAWALCVGPGRSDADHREGLRQMRLLGDRDDLGLSWQDTLAACLAATGETAEAVALQRSVVDALADMDPDNEALVDMRARLEAYARGEAWIETRTEPLR